TIMYWVAGIWKSRRRRTANTCGGDDRKKTGAEEGTRTPTPLRVHGPEPCASANSATSALMMRQTNLRRLRREIHIYFKGFAECVKPGRPKPRRTYHRSTGKPGQVHTDNADLNGKP